MAELTLLDQTFQPPADFDVRAHLALEFQDQPAVRVRLRFAAQAAHMALDNRYLPNNPG